MQEYIVPQKFDLQSFLSGNYPDINWEIPQLHIAGIAQFQQVRQIQGEGKCVADMALIVNRPDVAVPGKTYAGIDTASITGVMVHVFDTHDKSSRLFTINSKDGNIDWDALRNAVQSYIQSPKGVGNHWQTASGVDSIQIHHASRLTEQVAAEIMTQETAFSQQEKQNFIQSAINGYTNSVAANEYARMIDAISNAINEISPFGEDLEMEIAQHNVVHNLQDAAKRAGWELSKISDVASLNMREQWTGHYAELQHKYPSEQASALAMITVTASAIKRYEHYQGHPEAQRISIPDVFVCQQIQESAIRDARDMGCTEYAIGQVMHPEIQSTFQMMSGLDQAAAYFGWAARAYSAMLPEENRPVVTQLLQKEAQQYNEPIPMDAFIKAVQMTEPKISQITGMPPECLPVIANVKENINVMRQEVTEPFTYSLMHTGYLTEKQQTMLQEKFVHCLVAESASREVDAAACAIAMYKASRELQQELDCSDPTLKYHLSEVCANAIRDMEANGINTDVIYAAQNECNEIGVEDVENDVI